MRTTDTSQDKGREVLFRIGNKVFNLNDLTQLQQYKVKLSCLFYIVIGDTSGGTISIQVFPGLNSISEPDSS